MDTLELEKSINALSPQQLCDFKHRLEVEASRGALLGQIDSIIVRRHVELAGYFVSLRQGEIDKLLHHERAKRMSRPIVTKNMVGSGSKNGKVTVTREVNSEA